MPMYQIDSNIKREFAFLFNFGLWIDNFRRRERERENSKIIYFPPSLPLHVSIKYERATDMVTKYNNSD